ncbi:MAG TPA: CBS domain-containing protein [Gaiellaceae bacterium]|nr:CBS domain-containing protein [Gaiellaceae bacterium]
MDVGIERIYRHDVFAVSVWDTLEEAARRLRAHNVGALMVFDEEGFIGIITERDLASAVAGGHYPETAQVGDYMTMRPITVTPNTDVREVAAQMLETEVRHLPVELDGRLVGVISLRDLLPVIVKG